MDEMRRVQKVGYNSLSVSIPKQYAKEMNLGKGDRILFREDSDGTLRMIPAGKSRKAAKATLKADQAGSAEMLANLVVGAYALGYDTIEVAGKGALGQSAVDRVLETVRKLRGMEVVESDERHIVVQSFIDPTKFPVDSLIKRLQILVSRSLEYVTDSLDLRQNVNPTQVAKVQEEVDELYWLILRQLLVALNRRELASEIGIESPLHASGDRVSAKTMGEIGVTIVDIAEELARLRALGAKMDPKVTASIRALAVKAGEAFNVTVESLLTPDVNLIGNAMALIDQTMEMERAITRELLESEGPGHARVLVSYFGQLARYCDIVAEIASHRLLRKTSRVATVQQ